MAKIQFRKLPDGSWGVNGLKADLPVGSVVTVAKRDGSTSTVKVLSHVEMHGDWATAAVQAQSKPKRSAGDSFGNSIGSGASYAAGVTAPGGRKCSMCGSRECPRAWNPRDLCEED